MNQLTEATKLSRDVLKACEDLRRGGFVLVYDADNREGETDLFFAAQHATPAKVKALRSDAGGLVFLAVDNAIARALGLPFMEDVFQSASHEHPVLEGLAPGKLGYDKRQSFSITINHRNAFTGVTDNDRAFTIGEFARLSELATASPGASAQAAFGKSFRAPGHVHLCVAAAGLLEERKGHTELGVALARLAGVTPVMAGAEMLGDGVALDRWEAEEWADKRNAVVLEGELIEEVWLELQEALKN
ncbi:MAG TPA: 3,4-dihydroxy-2-butanone-4-phosphate synthase [archaeon]|nr:3,4-dihydroxy-2-butanone-4-phosphate synthase [archaeon]